MYVVYRGHFADRFSVFSLSAHRRASSCEGFDQKDCSFAAAADAVVPLAAAALVDAVGVAVDVAPAADAAAALATVGWTTVSIEAVVYAAGDCEQKQTEMK